MNGSGTSAGHRHLFNSKWSKTIDAIYVTISVTDIICNSFICLIFYKEKSLRKPFNILLLNLSLVDMSLAFAIQPYIWIDRTKLGGNNAARFLCACSVGLTFFMTSGIANILTLSAITVFRYLGIVRNCHGRFISSNTIAAGICILTWVIGAVANIPNGLSFQYNEVEAICYRKWPNCIDGGLYSLLTTLFFALFPIVLAIICYAALVIHIWKRSFEPPGRNIAAIRARKRVAMLVGFLILTLILCWSPLFLVWILGRAFSYFPDGADGEYERQRLLRLAAIFILLNSVLDPFIYIYSSPEYRKGVLQLICIPWRRKVAAGSTRAVTIRNVRELNVETNQM